MDVQKMLNEMRANANEQIDEFMIALVDAKEIGEQKNHQFLVAHLDGKIATWKAARLLIEQVFNY